MKLVKKSVLSNGLGILSSYLPRRTAALLVAVNTGSCAEEKRENGVSHFVEHMVFEGTKTRTALEISNSIEGIGGEIGAYTTNERTCFYVKVLPRHLTIALDVLFDILCNPVFDRKSLEKERKVILSEIDQKHDEPRFYQWELFVKALFPNHPMSLPVSGTKQSVSSITRQVLVRYYREHYVPGNMRVVYCGPKTGIEKKMEKVFGSLRPREVPRRSILKAKSMARSVESRTMNQSYLVLGYQTIPRSSPDSYALDVIRAILGKGLSGRIVEEIRAKRGLAYEVGCQHESGIDYGLFAVYLSTQKKNLALCESIIKKHISGLGTLSTHELEEAKNFVEGEFVMDMEDSHKYADALAFWDFCSLDRDLDSYAKRIRAVTKKDVLRTAKAYLGKPSVAILKQKSG